MSLDKSQLTKLTSRQKAIAGVVVLIVIVIIWQVVSIFGGSGSSDQPPSVAASNGKSNGSMAMNPNMRPAKPATAPLSQQKMSAKEDDELVKLQNETQMKYVLALNELQMLKLSQALAETNKDIAAAKLATVKAQKDIVDLLTEQPKPETPYPGMPAGYPGQTATVNGPLIPQAASAMPAAKSPTVVEQKGVGGSDSTNESAPSSPQDAKYIVISVSQLLNKWSAVVTFNGKLYSVFVGDILPPDGSTVVAIDKYSIILERDGIQRKVSMVPLI